METNLVELETWHTLYTELLALLQERNPGLVSDSSSAEQIERALDLLARDGEDPFWPNPWPDFKLERRAFVGPREVLWWVKVERPLSSLS